MYIANNKTVIIKVFNNKIVYYDLQPKIVEEIYYKIWLYKTKN